MSILYEALLLMCLVVLLACLVILYCAAVNLREVASEARMLREYVERVRKT